MRLYASIVLCFLLSFSISAQQLEVFGGATKYTFYIDPSDFYSYRAEADAGIVIGAALHKLPVVDRFWSVSFSLNANSGMVSVSSDGGIHSLGSYTEFSMKKLDLGIGVYPISISGKVVRLDIGLDTRLLISNKTEGRYTSWALGSPGTDKILGDDGVEVHSTFTMGLAGRLGFAIRLTESLELVPQYGIYLGFVPEYTYVAHRAKSFRQYFCIGVTTPV